MILSSRVRSRVNLTPWYQKFFGKSKTTPTYLKGKYDIWIVRAQFAWLGISGLFTGREVVKLINGTMQTKQRPGVD